MEENKFAETPSEKAEVTENTPNPQPEAPVEKVAPEKPVEKTDPDYKTLYENSTREAMIWRAKANQNIDRQKGNTNTLTEAEMRQEFPDWEDLSDGEKHSRVIAYEAKTTAKRLEAEREVEKAERNRQTSIEMAIASKPDLQGREQAFREYAAHATRRDAPLDILIDAFLFKADPTPTRTNSNPGLEPGNGGSRETARPKRWTVEQVSVLQKTDPRKYRELLLKGDLDDI